MMPLVDAAAYMKKRFRETAPSEPHWLRDHDAPQSNRVFSTKVLGHGNKFTCGVLGLLYFFIFF